MPPKSGVKVKLDKQRSLRFGMRALYAIEDEVGWTTKETFERLRQGSVKALVVLIWAALLHEAPDLTIEEAADLVDAGDIDEIAAALNTTAEAQFGDAEGNRKAARTKKS